MIQFKSSLLSHLRASLASEFLDLLTSQFGDSGIHSIPTKLRTGKVQNTAASI